MGKRNMLISTILFSLMHVSIKFLSGFSVFQIAFFRALISLSICLYLLNKSGLSLKGNRQSMLWFRGFLGTASIFSFYYTLQNIPLATAFTISQLAPLFIGVFAAMLLKEKISRLQWLFLILAFSGVLLIKGFDLRVTTFDIAIAVFSALMTAGAHFTIKVINQDDPPVKVMTYLPLVSLPLVTPFAFLFWKTPTLLEIFLLSGIGLLAHFAQLFLTKAYQQEKASNLIPFYFLGVMMSILWGYLAFEETFNIQSITGMAFLIIAGSPDIYKSIMAQKKPKVS
ncbi:MAG: DMT family transporter [Sporocytophaga sp.]|uniref:DMT family transporter n=1 Tax=Sporocytophaga sp. TaxID=2231183 RepID=UPI001B0C1E9C|nr:DMT family transporter [Sporocytophaga sp.]MBO9698787.1 DMT family transporter [Sporocytophaga sp.]